MRHLLTISLLCCFQHISFAQQAWDEAAFRTMPPVQRYRFVQDYPYYKSPDGSALSAMLNRMLEIAREENDRHAVLALKYRMCLASGGKGFDFPEGKTGRDFLLEMEAEAKKKGYEVEETVAHHYLTNGMGNPKNQSFEQRYVEVQKAFGQIEAIGFEKFRDYGLAGILLDLTNFMWELEDFEKAFRYLSVAERFVEPTEEGAYNYTQVLSYLQTYWKEKKDYARSIGYARKILRFHQNLQTGHPDRLWRKKFWQGFASIEIAGLLIEQGHFAEGEQYASRGYSLSRAQENDGNLTAYLAEFDALQVLVPIKLKLGKMHEADTLLQRALSIKEMPELQSHLGYFKPLKLYRHLSEYHEKKGNSAAALRYARLAQAIRDSLGRRNDARKFEKLNQRLDAEKYTEKLQLVESEKQLQQWLRNAALAILALVLALAFANFRRLQAKRRQKETELSAAKTELENMARGFRQKSELVENLRLENEKLAADGRHSEYLEQLTSATILTHADWKDFKTVFEKAHPGFIARQKERCPGITPAETRLLVLEKLGLNTAEMANMLGVNKNTIHQTRGRLRRKVGG